VPLFLSRFKSKVESRLYATVTLSLPSQSRGSRSVHTASHVQMCVVTAPFPRAVTRVNRARCACARRPTGNWRDANACVIFCHRIDIKTPPARRLHIIDYTPPVLMQSFCHRCALNCFKLRNATSQYQRDSSSVRLFLRALKSVYFKRMLTDIQNT